MDLNNFTIKSQEAIQAAQTKAIRYGQMEVDWEHLLLALLEQSDGLAPRLLQRMEVPWTNCASGSNGKSKGARG